MKVRDYYQKYNEQFFIKGGTLPTTLDVAKKAYINLGADFNVELFKLCAQRSIPSFFNSNFEDVLHELNNKWNNLAAMFKEKNGISPINENGFKNLWNARIAGYSDIEHKVFSSIFLKHSKTI